MKDELFLFRRNALLSNLCGEWDALWRECGDDKSKLIKLGLMQQSIPYVADFSYRGLGLSKEYILANFADYINGKYIVEDADMLRGYTYALYVGLSKAMSIVVNVSHFMWCDCTIAIPLTKCPVIYVSNKSHISLTCDGCNSPFIYLFDESSVTIEDADESCHIVIYKYSKKSKVKQGKFSLSPKVKIFNKELRL